MIFANRLPLEPLGGRRTVENAGSSNNLLTCCINGRRMHIRGSEDGRTRKLLGAACGS
jgi:hypothetical protein